VSLVSDACYLNQPPATIEVVDVVSLAGCRWWYSNGRWNCSWWWIHRVL